MEDLEQRRQRAAERRRRMLLHKTRLQPWEHELTALQGEAALSLVTELTLESWSEAGREVPAYSRAETPYRFVPGRLT